MITPALSRRYVYQQDMSISWTSDPVFVGTIQTPCFIMLLGADATTTGTMYYEEAIALDDQTGVNLNPLVWVPVFDWTIAAGVFTLTAAKYFEFPYLLTAGEAPFISACEWGRLRYAATSGGSANQLNVSYYGKSYG